MRAEAVAGMVLGWVLRKSPFISARPARVLQNIVSKHSSQFRGNAQHDALEFLLWLLDRMHEDLGAASPAQQSRGSPQVGGPRRWVAPRGGRTPWLGGRRSGQVWEQGHRDALRGGGMELAPPRWGWGCRGLVGARVKGWWESSAAGLGRGWSAGRVRGVGRSPSSRASRL